MPDEKVATEELIESYRAMVAETFPVTTPSGKVFIVRKLTPMDYIREGLADIPNEFFKFMMDAQAGNFLPTTEEQKKSYEYYEKFLKVTLEKGIISPPVLLKFDKTRDPKTYLVYSELRGTDAQAICDAIMGKTSV